MDRMKVPGVRLSLENTEVITAVAVQSTTQVPRSLPAVKTG